MRYLAAVRNHWVLIAGIVVATVLATLLYSLAAQKRYSAHADLVVTPLPQGDTTFLGVNSLLRDSSQGDPVVTAAQYLSAPAVGDAAAARLGLQSPPPVSITPLGQSNVVRISVTASSPAGAARIANGYAQTALSVRAAQLQRELHAEMNRLDRRLQHLSAGKASASNQAATAEVRSLLGSLGTLLGGPDPTLSLLSPAVAPTSAAWPRTKLSLAVALVGALLLGAALALALDFLSPTFRNEGEVRSAARLPVLAGVRHVPEADLRRQLLGSDDAARQRRERYRTLRSVLPSAAGTTALPHLIVVSSAKRDEGKTAIAVGLAQAIANSRTRVLLVDGDLRHPGASVALHAEERQAGLADVLQGHVQPRAALVRLPSWNFSLLQASPEPAGVELLEPESVASLLASLREFADVVVVDAPSFDDFTDAYSFASSADAVILCVRLGRTRRDELDDLLRRLDQVRVAPTGIVTIDRRDADAVAGWRWTGVRRRFGLDEPGMQGAPPAAPLPQPRPQDRAAERDRAAQPLS